MGEPRTYAGSGFHVTICPHHVDLTLRDCRLCEKRAATPHSETAAALLAAQATIEALFEAAHGAVADRNDAALNKLSQTMLFLGRAATEAEARIRADERAKVEQVFRDILEAVAWNENDGKCWCRESPDDGPGRVKPHEDICDKARALLGTKP